MIAKEQLTPCLIEEIKRVNYAFYGDTTLEWYYLNNKSPICICYRDKTGQLCGYLIALYISKAYYTALINGLYTEDINDLQELYVSKSPYCYISSVVVSSSQRNKGIAHKMVAALLKESFKYLCAMTVSREGYALLIHYMDCIMQVTEGCYVLSRKYH